MVRLYLPRTLARRGPGVYSGGVRLRSRRGQASVEYMLLLCTVLTMALMTGTFLAKYGRDLVDRAAEKVLEAALTLALP